MNLERQALEKRRAKSRQRGESEEDSPNEDDSNEDDDDSDGSGGDLLSKDARTVNEEVEASPVAKRTPWPIGLHSVEERRKKEEEEHKGGEEEEEREQRRQQEERLEEQLEQCRQQELLELQWQQQQWSQQLQELLEQPPRSPRQPVLPSPQGPETREEGLPVYGPPTPVWLHPAGPASIPAEPGRKVGVVAIACAMRTLADPNPKSRAPYTVSMGSPRGSFEIGDRGRISAPRRGTTLALLAVATPMRPGPRGRWTTTGGSLPSSTYSCATEVRSRPFKSLSKVSRHAQRRRWRTGAPVGFVFEPPPTRRSPTS